jgi:tetratricopeptide (TPR) repeat protein
MLGHFAHAATTLWLGKFVEARAVFEQCRGMDDLGHRAAYEAATGADQHLVTLAHFAVDLTDLGYLDQGCALASRALSVARRSGHAYSIAFMSNMAAVSALWSGSFDDAEHYAEEAVAVSTENDFLFWLGHGLVFYGYSLTELGQPQAGLEALQKGLATYRPTGSVLPDPTTFNARAEAHRKLGQPAEALKWLAEAEHMIEETDTRFLAADYNRIRGDVLVDCGDPGRAEESYIKALSVARRQGGKLWELRAATSLARLWRDQGKRTE